MRDTIDMAREASNTPLDYHATPELFGVSQLERFAALVREDEREACAKVAERFEPSEKTSYVRYASQAIRARGENT